MRIYLVSPTHYAADGTLHKTTRYWTSALTLPYLKALTPPEHEVTFVDELMQDVDLDHRLRRRRHHRHGSADRARLRPRRPSSAAAAARWCSAAPGSRSPPRSRSRHADAVVAGEAEEVWPQVLDDLAAGRSRGIYRAAGWHLAGGPAAAIDYLDPAAPQARRVPFERALPHVLPLADRVLARLSAPLRVLRGPDLLRALLSHAPGRRRARATSARIKSLGGNRILFLDDNPIAHPEKAKELFRAMIPLKAQVGDAVDDQHRARPRAARPRRAQRLRQPLDRPREHQRGEPQVGAQGLQSGAALRRGHRQAPPARASR